MGFQAARSLIRRERERIRPPVPATISALGLMLNTYQPCRDVYRGMVSAPGNPDECAVIFAGDQMLQRLSETSEIYIDGTFDVRNMSLLLLYLLLINVRK